MSSFVFIEKTLMLIIKKRDFINSFRYFKIMNKIFANFELIFSFINQNFLIMKKLDLSQMEKVNGGWSWEDCLSGAGRALVHGGWVAAAAGGWIGVGALAAFGCVVANT